MEFNIKGEGQKIHREDSSISVSIQSLDWKNGGWQLVLWSSQGEGGKN